MVVGGGTMGVGIALAAARGGYAVEIVEPQDAARLRGLEYLTHEAHRGDDSSVVERITWTSSIAPRSGTSVAIEAVPERFEMKRTQAREFFDELTALSEKELKRSWEFVLPGMVKLVVQKRKARMGRNPATGEAIKIPAKTVVKARIAKQLKDAVLPRK